LRTSGGTGCPHTIAGGRTWPENFLRPRHTLFTTYPLTTTPSYHRSTHHLAALAHHARYLPHPSATSTGLAHLRGGAHHATLSGSIQRFSGIPFTRVPRCAGMYWQPLDMALQRLQPQQHGFYLPHLTLSLKPRQQHDYSVPLPGHHLPATLQPRGSLPYSPLHTPLHPTRRQRGLPVSRSTLLPQRPILALPASTLAAFPVGPRVSSYRHTQARHTPRPPRQRHRDAGTAPSSWFLRAHAPAHAYLCPLAHPLSSAHASRARREGYTRAHGTRTRVTRTPHWRHGISHLVRPRLALPDTAGKAHAATQPRHVFYLCRKDTRRLVIYHLCRPHTSLREKNTHTRDGAAKAGRGAATAALRYGRRPPHHTSRPARTRRGKTGPSLVLHTTGHTPLLVASTCTTHIPVPPTGLPTAFVQLYTFSRTCHSAQLQWPLTRTPLTHYTHTPLHTLHHLTHCTLHTAPLPLFCTLSLSCLSHSHTSLFHTSFSFASHTCTSFTSFCTSSLPYLVPGHICISAFQRWRAAALRTRYSITTSALQGWPPLALHRVHSTLRRAPHTTGHTRRRRCTADAHYGPRPATYRTYLPAPDAAGSPRLTHHESTHLPVATACCLLSHGELTYGPSPPHAPTNTFLPRSVARRNTAAPGATRRRHAASGHAENTLCDGGLLRTPALLTGVCPR